METGKEITLTDREKAILEFYLYEKKDFDLVFEYLKSLGIEKDDYNVAIRLLKN